MPTALESATEGAAAPPRADRPAWFWFLLGCVAPGMFFFSDVLVHDRNFVYRDAGHFYYPYYKLIAEEWGAGRLPLWNPYENGGEPLAAQPTAAAFYPGKLVFALPYGLAYKIYLLGHWILAWWTCFWAGRGLGLRRSTAAFAASAYAFSGFVVFQLYNIVFLVGAAWLPLGLLAVDRIVARASWRATLGLAAVLAMQVLGGDPEIAMITLLAGTAYALVGGFGWTGVKIGVAALFLGHGVVRAASWAPSFSFQPEGLIDPSFGERFGGFLNAAEDYPRAIAKAALEHFGEKKGLIELRLPGEFAPLCIQTAWTGVVAPLIGFAALLWMRKVASRLWRASSLRALVAASSAAALLAAVQILPTRDLVRVSDRSAPEAPHESIAFSLFPARALETAYPALFGRQLPVNTRWSPFNRFETGIWTPTLYCGLATPLLAFLGSAWRRGSSTRVWLTWLTLFMFWLAIGKYGGLYWLFDPQRGRVIDPVHAPRDVKIYGYSDGLYLLCEETIPIFASFRYPEKVFVFCTLGLALLAGFGIERMETTERRRRVRLPAAVALVSLALTFFAWLCADRFETWAAGSEAPASSFGPLDPAGARRDLFHALGHGTIASLGLAVLMASRSLNARGLLAPSLLIWLCIDVASANAWLILTDEQSAIDAKPRLAEAIEKAERAERPAGDEALIPFRIHRARVYSPPWNLAADPKRLETMVRWEHNTLQPKYGLPWRLEYAYTTGTMSIYDVEFFFAPWVFNVPEEMRAQAPRLPLKMTYFPRAGYNLWNAKYLILPRYQPLDHEERGVFTLTHEADGRPSPVLEQSPQNEDDYVLLRNPEAFPRAWIVHQAEIRPPIVGLRRVDRERPMERLLYRSQDGGFPIWKPEKEVFPLRRSVLLETSSADKLEPFKRGGAPTAAETVRFLSYEPGRVEMEAELATPGLLVASETYFSGWKASVDGRATTIVKANRAMRAIPVPAGKHRVVMWMTSPSLLLGAAASGVAWLLLCYWFFFRRDPGRNADA